MRWETGLLLCQRPDAPLSILICKRLKGVLSRGSSASFHAWFTLICLIGHKDLETAHLSAENVQGFFFPLGIVVLGIFWLKKKIYGTNLAPVQQAAWVCLDLSYPSRKEFVKWYDYGMWATFTLKSHFTIYQDSWRERCSGAACAHKMLWKALYIVATIDTRFYRSLYKYVNGRYQIGLFGYTSVPQRKWSCENY